MDESNKRQRTASSNNNELHINDLPDGVLKGISSYLAKPSKVLFSIARRPNGLWIFRNWSVLDFNDIEKSLAAKLSDDDIGEILKRIDAVNRLQILKLAGCVNITGSGLSSLSRAWAIQQIDLSLVGKHEVPLIEPEPKLSEDLVLPILDSIIIIRERSLKQLELPKKWRNTSSTELTQFFERYSNYLESHRHRCSKCDRTCTRSGGMEWIDLVEGDEWHATQSFTCSGCLNYFCSDGNCLDNDNQPYVRWCKKCERGYCRSCSAVNECVSCNGDFCVECSDMNEVKGLSERLFCDACYEEEACHICNRTKCSACVYRYECDLDGCDKAICDDCVESKGEGGRCDADSCGGTFCSTECRYLACGGTDATKACPICLMATASAFRSKLQESKKEIEELCQGMDDLYKKYMNVEGDGDN